MNIERPQSERASVAIVTLILLLIMVVLVTVESTAVIGLRRQVKEVEKRQVQRTAFGTNQPPAGRAGANHPLSR